MKLTLKEIANIVNGKLFLQSESNDNFLVNYFTYNTSTFIPISYNIFNQNFWLSLNISLELLTSTILI